MNICMVTHDLPPQVGGIAAHIFELTNQLVNLNHKIIILTANPKSQQKELSETNNFQIRYVNEKFEKNINSIFLPITIIDYCVRARNELKKIINEQKIDLVHYHNLVPESLFTKGIKIPVVFTVHESHFVNNVNRNRKRLYFYLSHIDHLIASSQDRLDMARKFCPHVKSAHYIPNGIDCNRFNILTKTNEIKKKYRLSTKDKTILIVSRLEAVKGVIYFIEAIPKIIREIKNINEPNFKILAIFLAKMGLE